MMVAAARVLVVVACAALDAGARVYPARVGVRPRAHLGLSTRATRAFVSACASATPQPREARQQAVTEFDSARLAVRAGRGGDGRVERLPKSSQGLDRDNLGELIPPFGGGRGGDVVLYVDTSVQTLLNLTEAVGARPLIKAADGGRCEGLVNYRRQRSWAEAESRLRGISADALNMYDARPTRVPVPPGTVVRTKQGRLLADLVSPDDEVVVAEGGEGGLFLFDDPRGPAETRLSAADQKEMARGQPGDDAELELILRTVADVGFIGFPDAGKSTLLARLTRAKPTIGAYPFTTLIPNVGRVEPAGAAEEAGAERPVLVDLPGLIADAHRGRGLGRLFLRHVRRCRVLLYVLDAASSELSPAEQYAALHRELALYNPEYVQRPHAVALNKLDLAIEMGGADGARELKERAVREIESLADGLCAENAELSRPLAVVGISAKAAKGLDKLQAVIDGALGVGA